MYTSILDQSRSSKNILEIAFLRIFVVLNFEEDLSKINGTNLKQRSSTPFIVFPHSYTSFNLILKLSEKPPPNPDSAQLCFFSLLNFLIPFGEDSCVSFLHISFFIFLYARYKYKKEIFYSVFVTWFPV